ncbi:site-specific DNA-methyltransferase [Candidatus Woesearchaeota archaeon]|nr:site-specific DNA-methyltransferase [Candidatus Woesearchaeota archaeon]
MGCLLLNTNIIYCGDCLTILKGFPDECIDLIYLDPPFFSNRHYEVIWGNHAELRAFGDRWQGSINHYTGWMGERLEQCKRVLKKEGSIYLHCDYHASHYLKIKMDKIFDESNFRNEIVWHYKKWSAGWQQFQRNHDIILFYSKTDNKKRVFNKMFMDRAESTLKRFGTAKIISGYDEKTGKRIPS